MWNNPKKIQNKNLKKIYDCAPTSHFPLYVWGSLQFLPYTLKPGYFPLKFWK